MRFFKETKIDFMSKKYLWISLSALVIIGGIISLSIRGINVGIEFVGGTEIQLKFIEAKSIQEICQGLVERFDGEVPARLEDLVTLSGIGRKTANLVLSEAFDIPGIIVDTHVKRVAGRIGLTREKDPVKIEFDLMALIPRREWTLFSLRMIYHGRGICPARRPRCTACGLRPDCPHGLRSDDGDAAMR